MKKRSLLMAAAAALIFATMPAAETSAVTMRAESVEIMPGGESDVWELLTAGICFTTPDAYNNAEGIVTYTEPFEYTYGCGVFVTEFYYIGMNGDDFISTVSRTDLTEEEITDIRNRMKTIAYIMAIDGGRDDEDLLSFFRNYGITLPQPEYLGEAGDYTFYQCLEVPDDDDLSALGDFADEYVSLTADASLIEENIELSEPNRAAGYPGLVFETTDLEGNTVSSTELFGASKVTMVNFWTTWCTYCIREMPELQEMNQTFAENGGTIIGVLCDANEAGAMEEAQEILEMTGVTYQNLTPWDTMNEEIPLQAYPTTIFVDSEGQIVGGPVAGAQIDVYRSEMEKLLAKE